MVWIVVAWLSFLLALVLVLWTVWYADIEDEDQ